MSSGDNQNDSSGLSYNTTAANQRSTASKGRIRLPELHPAHERSIFDDSEKEVLTGATTSNNYRGAKMSKSSYENVANNSSIIDDGGRFVDEDYDDGGDAILSVDDCIAKVGVGRYQLRFLFFTGLLMATDALQVQMITFIEDRVQDEFNLSESQFSVVSSMLFVGMMIGAPAAGFAADRIGRKKMCFLAMSIAIIGGGFAAAAPSAPVLGLFLMISGIGVGGLHPGLTLFMELMPTQYRLIGMILWTSFWTFGIMSECLIGYLTRNLSWRFTIIASTAPICVALSLYPLWEESPRFQAMENKLAEATRTLKKVGRLNGRPLPDGFVLKPPVVPKSLSVFEGFSVLISSNWRMLTGVVWLLWFTSSLNYYCLILIAGNAKFGDVSTYASTAIISSAEFPSYVLQYILGTYAGRKKTFSISAFIIALLFLFIQLFGHDSAALKLGMVFVARLVITTMFDITWMFTPEAYPTQIRTTGVGFASAISRVSGVASPYVALPLYHSNPWVATFIFIGLNVLTALCSAVLPFETKDRQLEDAIGGEDDDDNDRISVEDYEDPQRVRVASGVNSDDEPS